jgi:hypothetical protein
MNLEIASEMTSVKSGMALEMVTEMVSELDVEMASVMPSESQLIDWAHLFRGDPR